MHGLRKRLIVAMTFFVTLITSSDMFSQIDATFSSIAPSCANASDGQLCFETITGGVPPYSFSVVQQVGSYNPITDCFENMPSGTFNINITDSQNNQGSAIGYVGPSDIPPVTVAETVVSAGCGNPDGSVCCLIGGGSGSFSYLWYQDTGAVLIGSGTTTAGQTICINGLASGDYTLIIDDLNTICGDIFSIIVPSATLSATASTIATTCTNACNGSILVDLSSAIAPVSISWSGTSSGSVSGINGSEYLITGLCQGTYNVTVDDASSCSPVLLSGQTIGLDTYAEISATFNITPASSGASDGSICATVTGGSGSFSYNWTGPPAYNTTLSTTNCLSGVPAGTYQLFIDDLNSSCSRQYSRTISEAALTVTATATAATCQLWPNPCHNVLKGIIPTDAVAVRFIDQTGRVVIEEKVFYPNQQWDVSALERGVYVVEVELADKRRTSAKLIRQ